MSYLMPTPNKFATQIKRKRKSSIVVNCNVHFSGNFFVEDCLQTRITGDERKAWQFITQDVIAKYREIKTEKLVEQSFPSA